jgi:cytochrome c oxidase cbb3-type subunit 2
MDSLRTFVIRLAVCLGVPWFFLVVRPYASERGRQPVPYGEKDAEANSDVRGFAYPAIMVADKARGAEVYRKEGCAQCHTQIIRPTYAGWDQWKRGYGANQDPKVSVPTRQTTAWDYMREDFAPIGLRRIGADLSNAGYRFKDANAVHALLYAPQSVTPWSNMPSFKHLYDLKKIEGERRADAVTFPKGVDVPDGWQVVPTYEATALAEYMLALKRDLPLPDAIAPLKAEAKK